MTTNNRCSEELSNRVRRYIKEECFEKEDLDIISNPDYNYPENLISALKKNKNSYIVVVTDEGLDFLWDKNIKVFIKNLKTSNRLSSWVIAVDSILSNSFCRC